MARWHVNPETGDAGACRANAGGCPFGGAFHGDSREACEAIFAEEMLGEETFLTEDQARGSMRQGMVELKPNLTADERRSHVASLTVEGSQIPPMSFASSEPVDLEKIDKASDPASTTVPHGGLWLSRTKDGGSDWTPSMKGYRTERGAVVNLQSVEPRADARILRIDSYEDLAKAMGAYPGSEKGWYGKALDVEKLKEDGFDGIYLTRKGFLDTRPHPENGFASSYKFGQEEGRTEIEARRVNTHGWVPSMVLFNRDAVGKVGEPGRIHRDGAGKNVDLMIIGERAAASKFGSVDEFVKAQKDQKVLELVTKYRLKTKQSPEQLEALKTFEREAVARGYSNEEMDKSYASAKREAHFNSAKVRREMDSVSRSRFDELHATTVFANFTEELSAQNKIDRQVRAEFEASYDSRSSL